MEIQIYTDAEKQCSDLWDPIQTFIMNWTFYVQQTLQNDVKKIIF